MKYRVALKVFPENVGEAFANTDSQSQAEMLNAMATDLRKICGSDFGMQLVSVVKDLNKHGKDMIKSLNDFIEFDND